jgi:hypothetical protein
MKDESFEAILREREYEGDERGNNSSKDKKFGDKAHKVVLRTLWQRMEQEKASRSAYGSKYLNHKFGKTSWAFMQAFPSNMMHRVVELYEGFRMLALCRTGGFWTGKKLLGAFHKEEDNIYRRQCFCCNKVSGGKEEEGAETIRHLIIECDKWEVVRKKHLGQILSDVKAMAWPLDGRVVLLLGGEYNGRRLEGWLPSKDAKPHDTVGEGVTDCIAFKVAAFLQEIADDRHSILSRLELELSPHDSPLKSQCPKGRVSLERQDFDYY